MTYKKPHYYVFNWSTYFASNLRKWKFLGLLIFFFPHLGLGVFTSSFDEEDGYTLGDTPLATQPGTNEWPWYSSWVQGQGNANNVSAWDYSDPNLTLKDPLHPTKNPTDPVNDPPAGDGVVQIANASTVVYRSFTPNYVGTVEASYYFYINSTIISSTQPVSFSLFLSNEGVGFIQGQLDIPGAVGVQNFGQGNTIDLQWGYYDPTAGNNGEWVRFSDTDGITGSAYTIAEGWSQLNLLVDLGDGTSPTYTAAFTGPDSQNASKTGITFGDPTDSSDNRVISVGFDRTSSGSGEWGCPNRC